MNAKIMFYEAFGDDPDLPTSEECAEYIAADLGVDCSTVIAELHRMDFDESGVVDENMFLAIYSKINEETPSQIESDWSLCTSKCDRCNRLRLSRDFLCSKAKTLRSHCYNCRGDSPLHAQPMHVFCRMDLPLADEERLAALHLLNMETAAVNGKGIDCWYVERFADPSVSDHFKETEIVGDTEKTRKDGFPDGEARELVENRIKCALFRAEGYRYNRSKRGVSSSRFICTQRSDSARVLQNESSRKRRRKESVKMESCGGVLTIRFGKNGQAVISCFHEYIHESLPQVSQITAEVQCDIQRGVELGLSPFQIVSDLNRQGKGQFSWSQVYYKWCTMMECHYKASSDVKLSARTFLRKSESFIEIFYNQEPFALGFLSNHARRVCDRARIEEAFIDSTFKTNSSKLELFAILGSFLGTGFPIAYLFLEATGGRNETESITQRKSSIRGFLEALHRGLRSFRPTFFFTDKDFGQISAISSIYGVCPSICLWHMKRAIKRKVVELNAEGVERSTKKKREILLDLVTKHFNVHPFFSTDPETIESLYLKNLQEIANFCEHENLPNVYSYLLANWYTWNRYILWGRRHHAAIAFTKTTMTIEAHWSIVKRQYLVHHNRPRLDFLLYIIDQQLMPKVESDFTLLLRGLRKPKWWKDFTKEWIAAKCRSAGGTYKTNAGTWTCSCPAYLRSRFLFCKHLIAGAECPAYRALVRNRHPPFLQFRVDPGRLVPDMGHHLQDSEFAINNLDAPTTLQQSLYTENGVLSDIASPGDRLLQQDALQELMEWTNRHISSLREAGTGGTRQLEHIEKNVLKRLHHYRERVQKSMRQRSAPKTWEHADTLFLP